MRRAAQAGEPDSAVLARRPGDAAVASTTSRRVDWEAAPVSLRRDAPSAAARAGVEGEAPDATSAIARLLISDMTSVAA